MDQVTVLFATGNRHKLREFSEIVAHLPLNIRSLQDERIEANAVESGRTFLENAKQKALYYARLSGLPTLAEDSGLEVDALDGRPGIYSARFGGLATHGEKRSYLLHLLEGIDGPFRTSRYCCAAVFVYGDMIFTAEATVEGYIGVQEAGQGGFGYDPLFSTEWNGPTFAEIAPELKNRISHRGRAMTLMLQQMEGVFSRLSESPSGFAPR
jgi:XTP/dITP diphosphohydrolase